MIPSAVRRKHAEYLPDLEVVQKSARDAVLRFCESEGFAYSGRLKDPTSLSEKLESGRYAKWSDIDDLFACSIIIPNLTYEQQVLDFLRSVFEQRSVAIRGATKKPPDQFRFDATRFRASLKPTASSERVHSIIFEVQIRSAFEHAWSVATHGLTYKGKVADWRALRLSAQMKAAVEQLDSLILRFEEAALPIVEHEWLETKLKQDIEKQFEEAVSAELIPMEVAPKDWGRFVDNVFAVIRSLSGYKRGQESRFLAKCLSKIRAEVQACNEEQRFPRSISLLQFCVGVLASAGLAKGKLHRYVPLVTEELTELYPAAKALDPVFVWDESMKPA